MRETEVDRGGRVVRVRDAGGSTPAPFQRVPGLLDQLDDTDRAALALLPGDPAAAGTTSPGSGTGTST
jgi:hypothetical protein